MRAKPDPADRTSGDAAWRAGVRRTALLFAAIAVVIYALFILSGVLAQ